MHLDFQCTARVSWIFIGKKIVRCRGPFVALRRFGVCRTLQEGEHIDVVQIQQI